MTEISAVAILEAIREFSPALCWQAGQKEAARRPRGDLTEQVAGLTMDSMTATQQAVQDQRLARGEKARKKILDHAVDVASLEGLEGLTIGRLANELGMSKSGLFAHFGSKEDLQLAVIDAARDIFVADVVGPSQKAPRGLKRLLALLDGWLDYLGSGTFSGGCFFVAAASEFDGRPGPVRDRIAELLQSWKSVIVKEIRRAREQGEIAAQTEAGQMAFELHAFVQEANWAYQLFQDPQALDQARRAIRSRLGVSRQDAKAQIQGQ